MNMGHWDGSLAKQGEETSVKAVSAQATFFFDGFMKADISYSNGIIHLYTKMAIKVKHQNRNEGSFQVFRQPRL